MGTLDITWSIVTAVPQIPEKGITIHHRQCNDWPQALNDCDQIMAIIVYSNIQVILVQITSNAVRLHHDTGPHTGSCHC